MKVILVKDSPAGKANTVVDVAAGYGQNYLIKNGFAVAHTPANMKKVEEFWIEEKIKHEAKRKVALELKEKLEKVEIVYYYKVAQDGTTHHSVSTKHLMHSLKEHGFDLDKHTFEKVHVNTLGRHYVTGHLYDHIEFHVVVEIKEDV